jgi:transcriptional regulator with XRE-family HTH domain
MLVVDIIGTLNMTLGKYFKERRRAVRLKSAEVCQRIGINVPELSRYENNHRLPSLKTLCRMTRILGLDFNIIMDLVDAAPKKENL